MMLVSKKLTFLGAAIVAATGLAAQESTGTMLGTVREPGNKPSARARLVIAGDAILGSRTLVTDENGQFRITLLPAGNYTLTVSKQGFVGSKAVIRISGGQILRQDFYLKEISAGSAEVEIVGVSAAVDKSETKTSTNFNISQLMELPLGLTSYAAIALAPGTTGSTSYPVIRGGLTGEAAVMVNGISIKDPSVRQVRNFEYVMGDMTEDISVIQSPLNAKYGNSAGGAVAITTKSGKNHFEGTFRVGTGVSAWNTLYGGYNTRLGNAIIANPSSVPADSMSKEYTISLFGPIIPDHLTFSYSGYFIPSTYVTSTASNLTNTAYMFLPNFPEYTDSRNGYAYGATPTTPLRAAGTRDSITQQYKLFWMVNQNHQVEFMYSKNDFGPYFQGFTTYDTVGGQSSIRQLTSVNYRGIIGNNGVLEVKWGQRKNEIQFANGPDDPITVRVWQNNPNVTTLLSTIGTSTITHNGLAGQGDTVLRNSESLGANYNWFNGKHNIDVGFEQLKDIVNEPPSGGPNMRRFYVPGRRDDGMYAVFNYVGSVAETGGDPYWRNNTAFIPEMTRYNYEPGGKVPEYTTNSIYVNDLWTINSNLSVMLGLRWDNWDASGISGSYINTSGISPRFEVKYDLLGNNQHLFTFSYAHFRGTIGSGSMGGVFEEKSGQQTSRYFWDKGTGTPDNPQWVEKSDIQNPDNYGFLYSIADSSVLYGTDPNLKPTNTIEYTLSYRRGFANGGSFRITGIYRDFKDIWSIHGTGTPVITNELLQVYGGYFARLEVNPNGKREHKGIEMEWEYPLYRSAHQNLRFQGSWTINRTRGNNPHMEGNNSYHYQVVRYALYDALGYTEDEYNPIGEYRFSPHNVVKTWLVWALGSRNGISNTFSLLARYTSGGPFNLTATRNLNQSDPNYLNFWTPTHLGTISDTGKTTTMRSYINRRGRFTDNDTYDADFAWNFTIPIKGRLQFFSEFRVYSIFNTIIPWGNTATPDDTVSMRFPVASGNWAYNYYGGMTVDAFDRFGLVNQRSGNRTYGLECGLRF